MSSARKGTDSLAATVPLSLSFGVFFLGGTHLGDGVRQRTGQHFMPAPGIVHDGSLFHCLTPLIGEPEG